MKTAILGFICLFQATSAITVTAKISVNEQFEFYVRNFSYFATADSCNECVQILSFDLPVGIHTVYIKGINPSGRKWLGATFKTDFEYLLVTDASGKWKATRDIATNQWTPVTVPCGDTRTYYNSALTKPFTNDPVQPDFIWADGDCLIAGEDEAWFKADINITREYVPANTRLVSASVLAGGTFQFKMGNYTYDNYGVYISDIIQLFEFYAPVGLNNIQISVDYANSLMASFEISGRAPLITARTTWNGALDGISYNATTCPKTTFASTYFISTAQSIAIGSCSTNTPTLATFSVRFTIPALPLSSSYSVASSSKSSSRSISTITSLNPSLSKSESTAIEYHDLSTDLVSDPAGSDLTIYDPETTETVDDSPSLSSSQGVSKITQPIQNSKSKIDSISDLLALYGIFIFVGIGIFVLGMIVIAFLCLRSKPRPKAISPSQTQDELPSFETAYIGTSMGGATMMNTDMGLSLPGFLKFSYEKDFKEINVIAKGGFGLIAGGQALNQGISSTNGKIAIKQLASQYSHEQLLPAFYQEISMMYYLRENKNIAKVVGYSEAPFCMLMKFYSLGSLQTWIYTKKQKKTKRLILQFSGDISKAVSAIHSHGFAHCDLKPGNILLDLDPVTKRLFCVLTDFGLAQVVNQSSLLVRGFNVAKIDGFSLAFAPPELIRGLRKSTGVSNNFPPETILAGDVYALAVNLYLLATRSQKF